MIHKTAGYADQDGAGDARQAADDDQDADDDVDQSDPGASVGILLSFCITQETVHHNWGWFRALKDQGSF